MSKSRRVSPPKPVVALDIDGTLGDYHGHFTYFAQMWTGRDMPDPATNTGGVPLYKWLGMSKATYRQCKLAYRQGGMKRSMPMFDGVDDVVKRIRKFADVWICTTRPYLRLDNIDPDTRHWLRRNRVQYDGVLFGPHKYRDLRRIIGVDRIIAVVDDEPEQYDIATSLGMPAILREQPYNLYRDDIMFRVDTPWLMYAGIRMGYIEWREKHGER